MSKHTPGPWTIARFQGALDVIAVVGGQTIGKMFPPDDAANARLIAAAPDMLEALLKGRTFLSRWSEVHGDDEDIDEEGELANAFGEALDALIDVLGLTRGAA